MKHVVPINSIEDVIRVFESESTRVALHIRRDLWPEIVRLPDEVVRSVILFCDSSPEDLMYVYRLNISPCSRNHIAMVGRLRANDLDALSYDSDLNVRATVASCTKTPIETLRRLVRDREQWVSEKAKSNLLRQIGELPY